MFNRASSNSTLRKFLCLFPSGVLVLVLKIRLNSIPTRTQEYYREVFAFGVLGDMQYTDAATGHAPESIHMKRFYRQSLDHVSSMIKHWSALKKQPNTEFKFILNLGDLVDNFKTPDRKVYQLHMLKALGKLKEINLNSPETSILHVWGNHDIGYNLEYLVSSELNTARRLGRDRAARTNYFSYEISERVRLVCLDGYEHSVYTLEPTYEVTKDKNFSVANRIIAKYLKETNFYLAGEWANKRFTFHSGAISDQQMSWLRKELEECKLKGKRVVLAGHIPLRSEAGDYSVIWNSEKILDLVYSFDDMVMVYLSGHFHPGGYFRDEHGLVHVTLPATLEIAPDAASSFLTGFVDGEGFVLKFNRNSSLDLNVRF